MAISTVSSKRAKRAFCSSATASGRLKGRRSTICRARSMFFPTRLLMVGLALHDFDAHVARRAHHGAHGGFETGRIEVPQLDAGDLLDLLPGHPAHLDAVRFRRTF